MKEIYAPTLSYKSFMLLYVVAVQRGFFIHQQDIKTAFLHANINRDSIYVRPPPGVRQTTAGTVWNLNKSLYGLRQSPQLWHEKISVSLIKEGFKKL